MLTPSLEKLIQKGKAVFQTHCHGVGGVGRIDVPPGSFLIITGWKYFHFLDPVPSEGNTPAVASFSFEPDANQSTMSFTLLNDPDHNPYGFTIGDGTPALPYAINLNWQVQLNQADVQAAIDAYEATLGPGDIGFGWHTVCTAFASFVSASFTVTGAGMIDFNDYVFTNIGAPVLTPPGVVITAPGYTPIVFTYQISGLPAFPPFIPFDPNDLAASLALFQAYLDTYFPGFTASVAILAGVVTVQVTTTTPGTAYNGIVPAVSSPFLAIVSGPFAGGEDPAFVYEDFIDASVHQMEFRSQKSRNHWVIQENVEFDAAALQDDPQQFIYTVWGHVSNDVYLVHTDGPVEIDIIKVPRVSNWGTVYQELDEKSQENNLPVGYGVGLAGVPAVRQVVFNGVDFYKPLSNQYDGLNAVASQTEFKLDVASGRELADPTVALPPFASSRNYPTVLIDYVLVKMNWNQFVNQS